MQILPPEPQENGHGRGVKVSGGQADRLDRLGLRFIRRRGAGVKVVDLGGGTGLHSVRMAAAGARVWMADLSDEARDVFANAERDGTVPPGRLHFLHGDFAGLAETGVPEGFHMLYSQRALHYLRYAGAQALLRKMSARMAGGGRAYISVAGVDSPFAENYPHRDRPVEDRFSPLAPDMRRKYHLHRPIAVYDDRGLRRLLESSGFTGVKTRLSEGGWNLQAVARNPYPKCFCTTLTNSAIEMGLEI